MRRHLLLVAACCAGLLQACQPPVGQPSSLNGQSQRVGQGAVDLSLASMATLNKSASYRAQEFADLTPEGLQVRFKYISMDYNRVGGSPGGYAISDAQGGGEDVGAILVKDTDYVDLSDQAAVEAALNKSAVPVPAGTYTMMRFRLYGKVNIKGLTQVGSASFVTKSASSSDTSTGSSEFVAISMGSSSASDQEDVVQEYTVKFPKPITISEGSKVKISLVYDLASVLSVNSPNGTTAIGFQYDNGFGLNFRRLPILAFAGEAPKPEIYSIKIDDPTHRFWSTDKFHFVYTMLVAEDGTLLGVTSNSVIDSDEAADRFTAPPAYFGDNLQKSSRNGDGTYHLVTDYDGSGFTPFEVPSFARRTHDGTLKVWSHNAAPAMTAPMEATYHATRIQ